MSCCSGGDVNRGGWGIVPELKLAQEAIDARSSAQPGRAPSRQGRGWPTWAWVLLALGVLVLLRRSA